MRGGGGERAAAAAADPGPAEEAEREPPPAIAGPLRVLSGLEGARGARPCPAAAAEPGTAPRSGPPSRRAPGASRAPEREREQRRPPRRAGATGGGGEMDPAPLLSCSLKDVKWSSVAVPLDLLVSTYRLPQIARLDSGESRRGERACARRVGAWRVGCCPRATETAARLSQPWRVALNSPQQQPRDGNQNPCDVI